MPSWKLIVGTIRSFFFHDILFPIKCYVCYVGQGKTDLHRISCSDKLDYCWPVLSVYYIEIEKLHLSSGPSYHTVTSRHSSVFWEWGTTLRFYTKVKRGKFIHPWAVTVPCICVLLASFQSSWAGIWPCPQLWGGDGAILHFPFIDRRSSPSQELASDLLLIASDFGGWVRCRPLLIWVHQTPGWQVELWLLNSVFPVLAVSRNCPLVSPSMCKPIYPLSCSHWML